MVPRHLRRSVPVAPASGRRHICTASQAFALAVSLIVSFPSTASLSLVRSHRIDLCWWVMRLKVGVARKGVGEGAACCGCQSHAAENGTERTGRPGRRHQNRSWVAGLNVHGEERFPSLPKTYSLTASSSSTRWNPCRGMIVMCILYCPVVLGRPPLPRVSHLPTTHKLAKINSGTAQLGSTRPAWSGCNPVCEGIAMPLVTRKSIGRRQTHNGNRYPPAWRTIPTKN